MGAKTKDGLSAPFPTTFAPTTRGEAAELLSIMPKRTAQAFFTFRKGEK